MTRICWWLVDLVSRMLEPGERDAVRGDFTESGESGVQALRDVLGLVVRRQAASWKDWRPWVAFVGLIIPLGMLLSIVSWITAGHSATYFWMYANNWDWALLTDRAFWYAFAYCVTVISHSFLLLVCWSWTAGFVLGSTSRRFVQVYGLLFCLMLVFGALLGAPRYFAYFFQYVPHRPQTPDAVGPVDALAFYRQILPFIAQAVLVAVPSLWGMRQGANLGRFPPMLRIVLWTAAISTLGVLVIQEPGFGFFLRPFWRPWMWHAWQVSLLQMLVYWPVVYWTASAVWRRRHGRTASI